MADRQRRRAVQAEQCRRRHAGGPPVGGVQLWEPKIDNWAFGVGVVLGTVDGFLLNLRGAFILELPGPRIIITVNLEVITAIGGLSPMAWTPPVSTSASSVSSISISARDRSPSG